MAKLNVKNAKCRLKNKSVSFIYLGLFKNTETLRWKIFSKACLKHNGSLSWSADTIVYKSIYDSNLKSSVQLQKDLKS